MASTRLKNAPNMYKREVNKFNKNYSNNTYVGQVLHNKTYMPGLGMNYPNFHSGINNSILSSNGADIESSLFGIGSTNLVQPKAPVSANLHNMSSISFFDAKPETNNMIPEPIVIHNQERYTIFRR